MEGVKLIVPLFLVSGNLSRYEHVTELSDFSLEISIFSIQDDHRAKPNMLSITLKKEREREFSVSTPEVKLAELTFIRDVSSYVKWHFPKGCDSSQLGFPYQFQNLCHMAPLLLLCPSYPHLLLCSVFQGTTLTKVPCSLPLLERNALFCLPGRSGQWEALTQTAKLKPSLSPLLSVFDGANGNSYASSVIPALTRPPP